MRRLHLLLARLGLPLAASAALALAACDARPVARAEPVDRCTGCHGAPPDSHASYANASACHGCHPGTVSEDGTINAATGEHMDGATALSGTGCAACHAAPPDTGAHRAHANPADPAAISYGALTILEDVAPAGGARYDFGCGFCHPADAARHLDGTVQVAVDRVEGATLKGLNLAGAAFDPASRTCSGVYCHSSGQEAPAFVETPSWDAAPGSLGCAGCHGNPPRYASGGAGSATANSHLGLDDLGVEWGHFAGLPGPGHSGGSKHGGSNPNFADSPQAASPITCQACHAETVDPASGAAGGFFWLDSTGTYRLDGGADPRPLGWEHGQCATCHGAGAPAGAGRVLPLRHVNGRRDVAFDRRRSLPADYPTGLPAFTDVDPVAGISVRPYYVSGVGASFAASAPADAAVRATAGAPVYTTTLESAGYDPATKTCSSVGCHANADAPSYAWGTPKDAFFGCTTCHPF